MTRKAMQRAESFAMAPNQEELLTPPGPDCCWPHLYEAVSAACHQHRAVWREHSNLHSEHSTAQHTMFVQDHSTTQSATLCTPKM